MRPQKLEKETYHLLKIFPLEVWNLIAKYLDTKSLICLLNSSLFFRKLLLDKRVEYLFQPVLQILTPFLLQFFGVSVFDCLSAGPKGYRYSKGKPLQSLILTLRLGCRSWNKAIQDLSCNTNYEERSIYPHPKSTYIYQLTSNFYQFFYTKKSSAFLEKFSNSHVFTKSNPFLGRTLFIDNPSDRDRDGDPQIFVTQIPQILKILGDHVWSLRLDLTWNFTTEMERHSKTVELLNNLPNLKNLYIRYKHWIFVGEKAEENISFSHFPSLKILGFDNWSTSSFNMFVCQTPQITHLSMFRQSPKYNYNLSPLTNLKSVSVNIFSQNDQTSMLENPRLTFFHLRKLDLSYQYTQTRGGLGKFVRWSSVFQMLSQKIGETEHFEELNLTLPNAKTERQKISISQDSQNERLRLKSLKRLTLRFESFYESQNSIDFLLGTSKFLEKLELEFNIDKAAGVSSENMHNFLVEFDKKNDQVGHIINFVGYASKMKESNIWDLFPALKSVELNINCCYLKTYERE